MIYIVTYILVWESLTPPLLRKSIFYAWGAVLTIPLQYLHDLIFTEYADGSTAPQYNNATAYLVGDRIVYIDRGVYECMLNSTGNLPTDTTYWTLISDNYIGIRERIKYSSQKLAFEHGLNRWFQSAGIFITNLPSTSNTFIMGRAGENSSFMPRSDTHQQNYLTRNYITPTTDHYTINVPLAVFNALAATNIDRENIIRAFADKYNLAGMTYSVATF